MAIRAAIAIRYSVSGGGLLYNLFHYPLNEDSIFSGIYLGGSEIKVVAELRN